MILSEVEGSFGLYLPAGLTAKGMSGWFRTPRGEIILYSIDIPRPLAVRLFIFPFH